MTLWTYIFKTFSHYLKANLLVATGVAVGTMVLAGALIIGDSITYSLEQAAFYRLGEMTHVVSAPERFFSKALASEVKAYNAELGVAPALMLEGMAVADGGQQRANRVQIIGIDKQFETIANTSLFSSLKVNEIILSRNLSEKLQLNKGDYLVVRIKKASLIPKNAPFVSEDEPGVVMRAVVVEVVDDADMGRFSLHTSQTAPFNLFLSLDWLNRLMDMQGRINYLLIKTSHPSQTVYDALNQRLSATDAGLKIRSISSTNEMEISSERVFIEPHIAELITQLPESRPILSYFVNGIALKKGDQEKKTNGIRDSIPYSFVSTIDTLLNDDEILLTRWAAEDIGAEPGDSISLSYFEIGPLRQLVVKKDVFVLKAVVPMSEQWADSTRMPWLPGLSDAGHCREWDAGVPISLGAIQDKDEAYWNEWKGAPKAYISLNKGRQLWVNRFGSITAVRFPVQGFDERTTVNQLISELTPGDIGMVVEPVRQNSIDAARNGTDFSVLFIGLSFFILAAAIILTALLFRLNLETRAGEVGILSGLGFRNRQVKKVFMLEGLIITLIGGIIGLCLAVIYTSMIFKILNGLWYDIVRTEVLMIKVYAGTLVAGLGISLMVSSGVIYYTLQKYLKQKTSELQKGSVAPEISSNSWIYDLVMWACIVLSLLIITAQVLWKETLNPIAFFLSGTLLLKATLFWCRKILLTLEKQKGKKINLIRLSGLNLLRNRNRSLTIIILFALGTFSVISTGSFKMDLLTRAHEPTSGTGGFLFFAKSSLPVLHDMNDAARRAEEGLTVAFTAIQFLRVDGDDASCLNLNRVAQPAILGVNPDNLNNRFSFSKVLKGLESTDPWNLLNYKFQDGSIPAIADQTVIQWGLGKKVGDVLLYQNEKGDTLQLRLVAGTAPSIFQGYVMISDAHVLENYPSGSGSYVFLVDGDLADEQLISDELQNTYRDYGLEMEPAAARLAEFYSVTNTYLSIFLALGALGLLLGTIGLAVILARSMIERRSEVALMQAVGFTRIQVFRLMLTEFMILIGTGITSGFIAAVLATLPSYLSTQTDVSIYTVGLIVILILGNGFIWIASLSWLLLADKNPAVILRTE